MLLKIMATPGTRTTASAAERHVSTDDSNYSGETPIASMEVGDDTRGRGRGRPKLKVDKEELEY